MPTSQYHQIPSIISVVLALAPTSVLDVGAGFGKYGVLLREYLEVWGKREGYGKFGVRIDALEVFPEYITALHRFVYTHCYIGDARTALAGMRERYDLALLVDVLEHFTEEEGREILVALRKRAGGVLISTPKYPDTEQHVVFGNVHETHRSRWTRRALFRFGPLVVIPDAESLLVYLGEPEAVQRLRFILLRERFRRLLLRISPWAYSMLRQVHRRT